MNFAGFYRESIKELTDVFISMNAKGRPDYAKHFREMLSRPEEQLIQPPVLEPMFPWEDGPMNFGQMTSMFGNDFIDALDHASFKDPADPNSTPVDMSFSKRIVPHLNQYRSWDAVLNHNKSIVVSSGTGSGKTECFMIPILKELWDDRKRANKFNQNPGVEAIFLYPLNALISSQRKRIHAWCDALSPKVTYGIYTGEYDQEDASEMVRRQFYPQLIDRGSLRSNPPQVLLTNQTILEYMMVRSADYELVSKSPNLKWIVLDEAHTYTGSAATELAFLIRRVLKLFNKRPDQVRFAIASATLGAGTNHDKEVREFVSMLTGKDAAPGKDFEFVSCDRVIPQLDSASVNTSLDDINRDFNLGITEQTIIDLRSRLNSDPSHSLTLKAVTDFLGYKTEDIGNQLSLIDKLSLKGTAKTIEGVDSALLPVRAHFFGRSILGVYACTNPECPSYRASHSSLGVFSSYHAAVCPHCQGKMLEVVKCSKCGELLLQGKEKGTGPVFDFEMADNKRPKGSLIDYDLLDDDGAGITNQGSSGVQNEILLGGPYANAPYSRASIRDRWLKPISGKSYLVPTPSTVHYQQCENVSGTLICPSCGIESAYCDHILFPATFVGRLLTHSLLKQSPRETNAKYLNDIVYEGRKYISFTDNRQKTAKTAKQIYDTSAREWSRSAIYHALVDRQGQRISDSDYERKMARYLQQLAEAKRDGDQDMIDDTEALIESLNKKHRIFSISWDEYRHRQFGSDLQKLLEIINRKREVPVTQDDYLKALFFDELGMRPLYSNSLETLGLIHLEYPAIDALDATRVPGVFKRFYGYPDNDSALADWKAFLRIYIDYFVRRNSHLHIPSEIDDLITQDYRSNPLYSPEISRIISDREYKRAPLLRNTNVRLNRCVLLLLLAKGVYSTADVDQNVKDNINAILREAWQFISAKVLSCDNNEVTDANNNRSYGYRLDIFDDNKVKLGFITKATVCPMTHQFIDVTFRGISPLVKGELDENTLKKYKVTDPWFQVPVLNVRQDSFVNNNVFDKQVYRNAVNDWYLTEYYPVVSKFDDGTNIQRNIFTGRDIYLAVEHSAQVDASVLRQSEIDFEHGKLNLLSCSTTMEMGVDIGGISVVEMNNVPPKPANYLQRTGRAGRRGETQAMAFTICNDNPVGNEVIRNPKWALQHEIEAPSMTLDSERILKRHINSLLLGMYIRTEDRCTMKDRVGTFFLGHDYGNPNVRLTYSYNGFINYLAKNRNNAKVHSIISSIVADTSLQGSDMGLLIDATTDAITNLGNEFLGTIHFVDAIIQDPNTKARYRNKLAFNLRSMCNENILTYLSGKGFIPSSNLPIGVVSLLLGEDDTKNPSRTLAIALSEYAPGNEVVISNYAYPVKGVDVTQSVNGGQGQDHYLSVCPDCGYIRLSDTSAGLLHQECPSCKLDGKTNILRSLSEDQGTSYTETYEPKGFVAGKRRRNNRPNQDYAITEPVLIGMESWKNDSNCVYEIRASLHDEARVLYVNKAKGYGYCFCSVCGKMEPENCFVVNNPRLPAAMERHINIIKGSHCYGNQLTPRRNILLSVCVKTDISEIAIHSSLTGEEYKTLLYSLGTVICHCFAVRLGIQEEEIAFGITTSGTIFIYDVASGGAGYSNMLPEYIETVLDDCLKLLSSCKCPKACSSCLVDRRSQENIEFLDRHVAIDWLMEERNNRDVVPSALSALFPNVEIHKVTRDVSSELLTKLTSGLYSTVVYGFKSDFSDLPRYQMLENAMLRTKLAGNSVSAAISADLATQTSLSAELRMRLITLGAKFDLTAVKGCPDGVAFIARLANSTADVLYLEFNNEVYRILRPSGISFTAYNLPPIPADSGFAFLVHKTTDTSSHSLFEYFMTGNMSKLDAFMRNANKTNVTITMTDVYISSPFYCILLAQVIKQVCDRYSIIPNDILVKTAKVFKPYYGNSIWGDFSCADDRNDYLKEAIKQNVGKSVRIVDYGMIPHARNLTIENDDFILMLNPDAGWSNGWNVYNSIDSTKVTDDINMINSPGKQNLYIQFTACWQKKNRAFSSDVAPKKRSIV